MQTNLTNFTLEFSEKIKKYLKKKIEKISTEESNLIIAEIDKYLKNLTAIGDEQKIKNILIDTTFTESLENILHIIAKFGDEEQLNHVLQLSKDLNYVNVKDAALFTPLHYAAQNGNLNLVKILLTYNVDKNSQSSAQNRKWTPIHFAAQNGHLDVVQALLEAGVSKETKTAFGLNILHIAAENGRLDLVKFLLTSGIDKNAKTIDENYRMTALHYAVIGNYTEIVKALLAAAVDINALMTNGATALKIAAENNYVEIAELLMKYGANGAEAALKIAKVNSNDVAKKIEIYQKTVAQIFKDPQIFIADLLKAIKSFNRGNLSEEKFILADDVSFNAYGIAALKLEVGIFFKEKKSLIQVAEKQNLGELVSALKGLAQLIK